MKKLSESDGHICRVILLRFPCRNDPEVFLDFSGAQPRLPEIRITRSERVAEQLTEAFKETYRMDVIDLYSIDSVRWQSGATENLYEVMEPYDGFHEAPSGHVWAAVRTLVATATYDSEDFEAIRHAARCTPLRTNACSGPFAIPGWFQALELWVEQQIRTKGLRLRHRYRQLNACPTFSLVRFETDGPAIWFKAVGVPNEHEYRFTIAVAKSQPRFFPQVIATRPDLNGWLALETEGPLLRECRDRSLWEAAASDLAELQISWIGKVPALLEAGARDLRFLALMRLVDPYFDAMVEVMDCQSETPPARISGEQLRRLSREVQKALGLLEQTALPETLGHLDLNPGNIVCSPRGSVFLDWAEGFIGYPFIAFEYLVEHFRRAFGRDSTYELRLVASYFSRWREFATQADMDTAWRVVPLIAAFACAARVHCGSNSPNLQDPRTAGYLRALTRRMDREASRLRERSVYDAADRAAPSLSD